MNKKQKKVKKIKIFICFNRDFFKEKLEISNKHLTKGGKENA